MGSPKFTLFFDGACLPNPNGCVSIAYVLLCDDVRVQQTAAILGHGLHADSEAAEYHALIEGLNTFMRHWVRSGASLDIRGDCLYVIKRLQGEWTLKRPSLLHLTAENLVEDLHRLGVSVTFQWISREHNTECDALAKRFREEKFHAQGTV